MTEAEAIVSIAQMLQYVAKFAISMAVVIGTVLLVLVGAAILMAGVRNYQKRRILADAHQGLSERLGPTGAESVREMIDTKEFWEGKEFEWDGEKYREKKQGQVDD